MYSPSALVLESPVIVSTADLAFRDWSCTVQVATIGEPCSNGDCALQTCTCSFVTQTAVEWLR